MGSVRGVRLRDTGLVTVLGATAFAGIVGYAIQLFAASALSDAQNYITFSVFWSTMFLFGGAVGGAQQELARATHPLTNTDTPTSVLPFIAISVGAVISVGLVASFPLAQSAFAADPYLLSMAFVIGLVGYVLTAVLTGILYGVGKLHAVGLLITSDALLRGIAVMTGLASGASPSYLAFAIALPFGLAVAIVWLVLGRQLRRRYWLDANTQQLALNTLRTVGAAASVGVMVAGLPLLLETFLSDAPIVLVSSLILTITVTRAPLIIPLMALQSYLVVSFRGRPASLRRRVTLLFAGLLLIGVVGSIVAYYIGPWAIALISSGRFQVEPIVVAIIVGSAALVGLMCITSAALLAFQRHNIYLIGWGVAAILTIASLALAPMDGLGRAMVAICGAPVIGLVIHLIGVFRISTQGESLIDRQESST